MQLAEACQKGNLNYCCMPPIRKIFTLKQAKEETRFGMWVAEFLTNIDESKLKKQKKGRVAAINHNNRIGRNVSFTIFTINCALLLLNDKMAPFDLK